MSTSAVTARSLPRDTPSGQGVDASGIAAFVDALEAAADVEPHSLMLVRHGHVVAEGWWAPYTADRLHLLYSLSKSFTSAALGLAIGEGLVDLDAPVLTYFPELDAEITDPRSRRILVRHVSAMASGHREETIEEAWARDPQNLVRGFLLVPPDAEPGSLFTYNQPCTHTMAAIVARVSGQTLLDYLRPRLLDPLGIGEVAWARHPSGLELGYSGLHATTEDVARLGQLMLNRGSWHGRQLLPASWVDQATSPQIDTAGRADNVDWQCGYGYQFWRSRHGYRGDGAYAQFCLVLPQHDAVLAMTAGTQDMQAVLDAVWHHLLPALGDGPAAPHPGPDADAALATRLAALTLPTVPGAPLPPAGSAQAWHGFTARGAEGSMVAALTLSGPTGPDGAGHRIALDVDVPGTAQWHLDLPLGTDGWAVTEPSSADGVPLPLATSGGWLDARTLRVDVVVLETPHRLQLDCDLDAGTLTAAWHTEPLWSAPITELGAPRD